MDFPHQSIPARRQVHPPDPRGAEILKAVAGFGDLQQRHLRWPKNLGLVEFPAMISWDLTTLMGFSWDFHGTLTVNNGVAMI